MQLCQKHRIKDIDEARNYLVKEVNQNDLTSKKEKRFTKI